MPMLLVQPDANASECPGSISGHATGNSLHGSPVQMQMGNGGSYGVIVSPSSLGHIDVDCNSVGVPVQWRDKIEMIRAGQCH